MREIRNYSQAELKAEDISFSPNGPIKVINCLHKIFTIEASFLCEAIHRGHALHFLLAFLFFTGACTVQKTSPKATSDAPTDPTGSNDVGTGASATLQLWSRGPQQSVSPPDYTLDSKDPLNNLARQSVPLYDLNSASGNLTGPNLHVYYSKSTSDGPGKSTPLVSAWSSQKIPWDRKEFKSFMLYAHGSKAIRYMKDLFPTLNFAVRGKGVLPLYAYSSVDDNPLKTKYEINKDGRVGNILFFQNSDDTYNPSDEADAIYHEFAHMFQHILNPNVLETAGNYDMDMLLEGLADFFAASAVRDERILEYLASNATRLFSANSRTGRNHQRKMGNSLRFPSNYVGDFHLDARIVSSALNDIRRYLEGQTVTLYQDCGSNCAAKWNSASNHMSNAAAFDTANILAHEALREVIPTSSIIHYSERVVAAANRRSWSTQCGSNSSCKNELVSEITSILKSRGIHTSKTLRSTPFVSTGTSPELILNHNGYAYFRALFSGSEESNTDSKLDRCEAVLVIPDIRIRSGVQASAYDTLFELYDQTPTTPTTQVGGFTSLNGIDRLTQKSPYFDTSELEIKLWGFLLAGESIFNLAGNTSSRFYTQHQLSALSPSLNAINSSNPPPVGWAFRAPSTAGAEAYVEFAFQTRPFEVRYVTDDVYTIKSVKQKLNVSTSPSNFCN